MPAPTTRFHSKSDPELRSRMKRLGKLILIRALISGILIRVLMLWRAGPVA